MGKMPTSRSISTWTNQCTSCWTLTETKLNHLAFASLKCLCAAIYCTFSLIETFPQLLFSVKTGKWLSQLLSLLICLLRIWWIEQSNKRSSTLHFSFLSKMTFRIFSFNIFLRSGVKSSWAPWLFLVEKRRRRACHYDNLMQALFFCLHSEVVARFFKYRAGFLTQTPQSCSLSKGDV